jgi:hypothetical protein
MKGVLKSFYSPDIPDLQSYRPDTPDSFGFLLQAIYGPDEGPGDESFDMIVCTTRWLEEKVLEEDGILMGHHYLLVTSCDIERIKGFLTEYGSQCSGASWHEVAQKLGRLGKWEFEDYQEHPSER